MEKIIIDPAFAGQLVPIRQTVQLCTPDGQVLGSYIPASTQSSAERGRPPLSDEEIQRRLQQGGGRTLPEILADLEKRG
jgi:hypothetical protein